MRLTVFFLLALLSASGCIQDREVFSHDVETTAKPWSHEDFKGEARAFQFAILSDRNGDMRKGIFGAAVEKINLLQPEFVMSVGDYVGGYTTDREALPPLRPWIRKASNRSIVGWIALT